MTEVPAVVEAPVVPAEPVPDTRELVVVARLVEPQSAPHCGVMHNVVVMRYEVVQVLAGSYAAKDLYVAHSCPEMSATRCEDLPGEVIRGFRKNDVHRMRVDARRGSGTLVDKFRDKSARRYRARCANLETAAPAPP